MTTDTSEKGLETLIMRHMTGVDGLAVTPDIGGGAARRLRRHWLLRGQPEGLRPRPRARCAAALRLPARHPARGVQEAGDRRRGRPQGHQPPQVPRAPLRARSASAASSTCCARASSTGRVHFDLFYGTPSPGNAKAASAARAEPLQRHAPARATAATRRSRALDLCLFINGLPVATFELKNSLTKQTVDDAVEQYQRDRDPRERLFEFGRCVVHFAVDDSEVRICTRAARARARGSCRSTRAGTTARATRRTRTGSRPTTSGSEILTPRRADRHPRELRADRRGEGREDRQEEAQADLAALPPARRGAAGCWPTCARTARASAT